MKILFFIHSLACGGAERVTANLANHWVQKNWDVTIVTLASQNLDFYELHSSVRRIVLNKASNSTNIVMGVLKNIFRVYALRRTLKKVRPDVAIAMMATKNILLSLASLGLSSLRTIGSERTYPPKFPLGFWWEILRRHTYSLLNAVTVLTIESQSWLRDNTLSKRIAVVPNAVSYPLLVQEPRIKPKMSEKKILLAVGRLSEEKRFDLLIEAFLSLAPKHSDWDIVILGEGSLREPLERQVQKMGLEKRIFFPGRVGNVGEWYERANLYVMSSRFEGFPNTLVEAMAHGLPVVSFDCDTGPRDIIRNEVDGLLVPQDDVIALANSLDRLMGNAALRKCFAERAKEVRERFSMIRIVALWEELFKNILHSEEGKLS